MRNKFLFYRTVNKCENIEIDSQYKKQINERLLAGLGIKGHRDEKLNALKTLYFDNEITFNDFVKLLSKEKDIVIKKAIIAILADRFLKRDHSLELACHYIDQELMTRIQSILADTENLLYVTRNSEEEAIAKNILQEMRLLSVVLENFHASLDSTEETYHFSQRDISRCIEDALAIYQGEATKKKITFIKTATNDEKHLTIEVSVAHITRAFANLIYDAVKCSFPGSENKTRYIRIQVIPIPDYYTVEISYFGTAISTTRNVDAKKGDITCGSEHSSSKKLVGGFGLLEAEKIIESHHGKFSVTSEKEGLGYKTTIKVYLPFRQT